MSNDRVREDMLRPLANAVAGINVLSILLWVVAVNIIGSLVYLSALERARDFAVLKATGYSSKSLLAGLAVQSVAISLVAAIVAMGLARLLLPLFPIPATIPGGAQLLLPAIGVFVGLIACLFGARKATSADPALAFGGP
jgi:putative ABC transport system permease protein